MPNKKITDYQPAGELQPADLFGPSISPFGPGTSKKATHFQVTGGEKISKGFVDFSVDGLFFDLVVFTLKAGRKLPEFVLKHEAAWGDGAVNITEVKVELGIVGDEGKYTFEPFDILQAPSGTVFRHEEPNTIENMENDTDIIMRVTTVGANTDTLTTGSIDLFIFTKSMIP